MTYTDPGILFLIPCALIVMVAVAWPLEETHRGRDFVDSILDRWFR